MAAPAPKPYVKLATGLVVTGSSLFTLEQLGLNRFDAGHTLHIDGTVLSLMVLVPIGLVAAGALIFVFGKMRRL